MRRRLGAIIAILAAACGESNSATPDAAAFPDATEPSDAAEPIDAEPIDAGEPAVQVVITATRPPALLSEYHFFRWHDGRIEHNDRVIPYDLNTALFSDHALKDRAIYIPPNTKIRFHASDAFEFPAGSAIIKSFLFPADQRKPEENLRLVETRVLVRYEDGWRAFPYLWRSDGSDADYRPGGHVEAINFIDEEGVPRTSQYLVPQRNQCRECHELADPMGRKYLTIIGVKARHINRENQLERLAELDYLEGLPATGVERAFDIRTLAETSTIAMTDAELDKAARDYLDINCAHCHNPSAVQGVTSQLFLNYDNTDLFRLGICKEPGSAGTGTGGFRYNIVPGAPGQSIMVYRIETEIVGDMMPLIGRSLRDRRGTPLVRGFIERMVPESCD
jgi:uncharacterized repeat protein (TIGR03806 family)